ncbi:BLUF domain-containing protein [Roseivirga sp.]|uniref:BLUF domain-containing protein n=1 Tax=Roseivirga sp. TaxID=1964215 RepID=UPI003B51EDC5
MLYELIYRSTAKPGLTEEELKTILTTARQFNSENNITGCLLFHEGQFLQLLEGDFQVLLDLYDKIKRDPRHREFLLLHMKESPQRVYDRWTMAFKTLNNNELRDYSGVSEFTELETEEEESSISVELFQAISQDMVSH